MRGIILAGGTGSRLNPLTLVTSKQLLPVFNKPLIYYPLATLMLAGITKVLIISDKNNLSLFKKLFRDGCHLGIEISYAEQEKPNGIPEAFIIGENFINNEDVCLILGDNFFWGDGLGHKIKEAAANNIGATIFGTQVSNPERFGVVKVNDDLTPKSIEEKPSRPKSNIAVTGLYIYNGKVSKYAKELSKSKRQELEITDLNNIYLSNNELNLKILGRGFAWLDTGTPEDLLEASNFVKMLETQQNIMIACLEEVAFKMGLISKTQLTMLASNHPKTRYRSYLYDLISKN